MVKKRIIVLANFLYVNKEKFKLIGLLFLGISLIDIAARMAPQWVEFQSLSRGWYLSISIFVMILGVLCLKKPIRHMLEGVD